MSMYQADIRVHVDAKDVKDADRRLGVFWRTMRGYGGDGVADHDLIIVSSPKPLLPPRAPKK